MRSLIFADDEFAPVATPSSVATEPLRQSTPAGGGLSNEGRGHRIAPEYAMPVRQDVNGGNNDTF